MPTADGRFKGIAVPAGAWERIFGARGRDVCECEGNHDLFIWRGDPEWWSCACCDGRVTPVET